MHEIASWDLDRLYPIEDILTPILGLKEQYYAAKDVGILSNLYKLLKKQNTICIANRLKKVFHLTLLY